MLHINADIDCCGIAELVDIQHANRPEDAILRVLKDVHDQGVILFSEHKNGSKPWTGIGNKIKAYITANNLGTVVSLPTTKNPNSGNYIRAYLWRVNRTNTMRWGKKFVKENPQYAQFKPYYNPWRRDNDDDGGRW